MLIIARVQCKKKTVIVCNVDVRAISIPWVRSGRCEEKREEEIAIRIFAARFDTQLP